MIVLEDAFRTGYECSTCDGIGTITCPDCKGTAKSHIVEGARCKSCDQGRQSCPACAGKGGLIVAPETTQRRPTTGKIVSAGHDCKTLRLGQSVMYSNFAGYVVDLTDGICLRILHESEILCLIDGHLDLRRLKGKSEIAQFA